MTSSLSKDFDNSLSFGKFPSLNINLNDELIKSIITNQKNIKQSNSQKEKNSPTFAQLPNIISGCPNAINQNVLSIIPQIKPQNNSDSKSFLAAPENAS